MLEPPSFQAMACRLTQNANPLMGALLRLHIISVLYVCAACLAFSWNRFQSSGVVHLHQAMLAFPDISALLQVITLDMGLLVAGTKYRGEFEERLKKLMEEIKQNDDIILVSSHQPYLLSAPSLCWPL